MHRNFELLLANHCAPVLFSRKPAALLRSRYLAEEDAQRLTQIQGLRLLRLNWRSETQLAFLYHPALLEEALACKEAQSTLHQLGYPMQGDLRQILAFLDKRFYESHEFPHEIGFFLGYPAEDVLGFMECKAECKLCGPWKVYGDVGRAAVLFEEYERCRQALLQLIEGGGSIFTANLPVLAG